MEVVHRGHGRQFRYKTAPCSFLTRESLPFTDLENTSWWSNQQLHEKQQFSIPPKKIFNLKIWHCSYNLLTHLIPKDHILNFCLVAITNPNIFNLRAICNTFWNINISWTCSHYSQVSLVNLRLICCIISVEIDISKRNTTRCWVGLYVMD